VEPADLPTPHKLGQHQSPAVGLDVGVSQGSVLGHLLFAIYCSPAADVIVSHGVQLRQYADDTQLRLALSSDNTSDGHIRHLLSTDLAHTLACSLILTRLDNCNSVLYGAAASRSCSVCRTMQPESSSRHRGGPMPTS